MEIINQLSTPQILAFLTLCLMACFLFGYLFAKFRMHGVLSSHQTEVLALQHQLDTASQLAAAGEATADEQLEAQREELATTRAQLRELEQQLIAAERNSATLEAQLVEKTRSATQQDKLLLTAKQELSSEFENLANRIFEQKGLSLAKNNQHNLDQILKPFRDQIMGFQKRVNEIHTDSVKGNAALESEVKKVRDIGLKMSTEANTLAMALKGDKKTVGNWGEAQLEQSLQLAGLEKDEHYASQPCFKGEDGRNYFPDFVVNLPDGKHIVVDSKVSLIAYTQAVAADEKAEIDQHLSAHVAAVKDHIQSLHDKNYVNLPAVHSPMFVLMFLPIEPAYIEALRHDKSLFNYGYERNVVLVSHSTLMPVLRTVSNLWMIDRSNNEARELSTKAGDIYNQVCSVAESLAKVGGSLTATTNHFNRTVTALVGKQGLHAKVERFKTLSVQVNKSMPEMDAIYPEISTERLAVLNEVQPSAVDEVSTPTEQ